MSTCTIPSSNAAAAKLPRRRSNGQQRTDDGGRTKSNGGTDLICRPNLSSVVRPLETPNGENNEPRDYESFQPASAGSGLRPDSDIDREPGEDSILVLRRDQKA